MEADDSTSDEKFMLIKPGISKKKKNLPQAATSVTKLSHCDLAYLLQTFSHWEKIEEVSMVILFPLGGKQAGRVAGSQLANVRTICFYS